MARAPARRGGRPVLVVALVIRFSNVRFGYARGETAVAIPELVIPAGLVLVVGANGAGKSTMLRLAAGVERPDDGTVSIDGCDLWTDEVAARRRLAYVPEHPELTPYATIGETLLLVANLRNAPASAAADALTAVGLIGVTHRTVRELSMGQRRRALLATALIGSPPVLILDEPLETMDLEMRGFVRDLIVERRAAGGTIVVATHELEPFVADAEWVVGVRGGTATLHGLREYSSNGERLARLTAIASGRG
jgi:ABC-2 type transport system ATP-binding protein